MSRPVKMGVVTVTYNSGRVLEDFLESIACQTFANFILYFVDNDSKDDTLARIRALTDPRVRLIANEENVGVAQGNNIGIAAALADECDYVLFLNNDIKFDAQTFEILIEEIGALQCDLLGPKILYEDGIHIWSAGGGFKPLKGYLGFHIGEGEVDRGQFDSPKKIEHSPACCLLVRPKVFREIGIIDEKYFVYWDDTDFSYRAWKAGLSMFYTPKACILHKVSSLTGGSESEFTVRYNARGHVYFMLRRLGLWRAAFYLPAWEFRLLAKLLFRSIDAKGFLIRQRAFCEGIGMWLGRVRQAP